MTYYQNRVYVSLKGAGAYDCNGQIGPLINTVLTLHSSELYSVCRTDSLWATAFPYNYGDFESPVPASAWNCQPWCADLANPFDWAGKAGYSEIFASGHRWRVAPPHSWKKDAGQCLVGLIADEIYRPMIAIPTQLRAAHPDWDACSLDLFGIYDPPIVLTAQATAAAATLAPFLQTTAANPVPGIATSLTPAKATATAQAPTASPTLSQHAAHFTFNPEADSLPAAASSDTAPLEIAKAPLTISAMVIPQLVPPSTLIAPDLATAPATINSLPTFADSNPTTLASGPSNGNEPSPALMTAFAIGSQTARPGGPAVTASGTIFSALPSGAGVQVIVSGLTSTLGIASPGISAPSLQAGNILINSQTLLPGGTPVTQAGTIWSALPSGNSVQIVANGKTSTVIPQVPGITATASLKADIHIGSQILTPGGPAITSAGTTWSALPSGSGIRIIANSHTSTIGPIALAIAPAPVPTNDPVSGEHYPTTAVNNNSTSPTTSALALRPVGPASQSAWTIGGNYIITEGQAWTANGTIFSDISGTLFTGLVSSSISTALATVIKQGATVHVRDLSWGSTVAVGLCALSGVLAVVL
jgi:hypothetical protein